MSSNNDRNSGNGRNDRDGARKSSFPVFASSTLRPSSFLPKMPSSTPAPSGGQSSGGLENIINVSKRMKASSDSKPIPTATTNSIGSTCNPISTLESHAARLFRAARSSIACSSMNVDIAANALTNSFNHMNNVNSASLTSAHAPNVYIRTLQSKRAQNILGNLPQPDGVNGKDGDSERNNRYSRYNRNNRYNRNDRSDDSSPRDENNNGLGNLPSLDVQEMQGNLDFTSFEIITDDGFNTPESTRQIVNQENNSDNVECTIQNSAKDREDGVVRKHVVKTVEKKKKSHDEVAERINETTKNKAKVFVSCGGAQPPNGDDNDEQKRRIETHEVNPPKLSEDSDDETEEKELPADKQDPEVKKTSIEVIVRPSDGCPQTPDNRGRHEDEAMPIEKSDDDRSTLPSEGSNPPTPPSCLTPNAPPVPVKASVSPRVPSFCDTPSSARGLACAIEPARIGGRRNSTRSPRNRYPNEMAEGLNGYGPYPRRERGVKRKIKETQCIGLCQSYNRPLGHLRGNRRFYVDLDDPGAERAIERCDCETRKAAWDDDLQAYFKMIYS